MKTRGMVAAAGLAGALLLAGCAEDPNERANALYVAADQQAQVMREQAGSYGEALEAWRGVRADIEQILTRYDTSDLAVRLVSGEARVAGLTLSEFRALGPTLEELAAAVRDPVKAALVVGVPLEEPDWRESLVWRVVHSYAQSGQFEQAEAVFERLHSRGRRQSAYVELAQAYSSAGLETRAREALEQAHALFMRHDLDRTRVAHAANLAKAFLEIGREETAMRLYEQAIADPGLATADHVNVGALVRLSEVPRIRGDLERAQDLLSQAHEMATSVDRAIRDSTLHSVAAGHAALGQSSRVREIVAPMERGFYKALALRDSAERLEEQGYQDQAREMRDETLGAIRSLEEPRERAQLLPGLARQYTKLGESEQARDLLREAIASARAVQDQGSRAWYLALSARALVRGGWPGEARALVTEALEGLRDVEWGSGHSDALLVIGTTQVLAGMEFSERDLAALSGIVEKARPMPELW